MSNNEQNETQMDPNVVSNPINPLLFIKNPNPLHDNTRIFKSRIKTNEQKVIQIIKKDTTTPSITQRIKSNHQTSILDFMNKSKLNKEVLKPGKETEYNRLRELEKKELGMEANNKNAFAQFLEPNPSNLINSNFDNYNFEKTMESANLMPHKKQIFKKQLIKTTKDGSLEKRRIDFTSSLANGIGDGAQISGQTTEFDENYSGNLANLPQEKKIEILKKKLKEKDKNAGQKPKKAIVKPKEVSAQKPLRKLSKDGEDGADFKIETLFESEKIKTSKNTTNITVNYLKYYNLFIIFT